LEQERNQDLRGKRQEKLSLGKLVNTRKVGESIEEG